MENFVFNNKKQVIQELNMCDCRVHIPGSDKDNIEIIPACKGFAIFHLSYYWF